MNPAFLLEERHDGIGRVYLFGNLDDALENAGSLITLWLVDTSPFQCCPLVRERLRGLIGAKDYRAAIRRWNEYQNRAGKPEIEVFIHRIRFAECVAF